MKSVLLLLLSLAACISSPTKVQSPLVIAEHMALDEVLYNTEVKSEDLLERLSALNGCGEVFESQ